MARRRKINKRKSRRNFTAKARVNKKNQAGQPMRGGIRL